MVATAAVLVRARRGPTMTGIHSTAVEAKLDDFKAGELDYLNKVFTYINYTFRSIR